MNLNAFPTRGNLILAKNSLKLSLQGYELMDKKRNILTRELLSVQAETQELRRETKTAFEEAYEALQEATLRLGLSCVVQAGRAVPVENSVEIKARSVMGVEIPLVRYEKAETEPLSYGLCGTAQALDQARAAFGEVRELVCRLAMAENSSRRLTDGIQKTNKRANALQNVTIPAYETLVHTITNVLEEKEREEFTRLKVIKERQKKERP